MKRRSLFRYALGASAAGVLGLALPKPAFSQGVDIDAVLHDPDTPTGGNPDGDLTIVTFFDYNCPFCKKAAPALDRIVETDGNIRLVYKDWPILTAASIYGAKLALGARYQDQYEAAHNALMAVPGSQVGQAQMRDAVEAAGIDMARLDKDTGVHETDITDLLKRNYAQADALGLRGTPVFLVGPYLVAAALDYDGFRDVVSKARERQKG